MKKIKLLISIITLFFIFLPSISVLAVDDYCIWQTSSNQTNPCDAPGTNTAIWALDSTGGSCQGKPKDPGENICCCQMKDIPGQCSDTSPCPSGQDCIDNWCQSPAVAAPLFKAPDLQIKIPGLAKFSDVQCTNDGKCGVPWIGQYIQGIYNYALSIVGIIAAIVLMAGGVLWLISGGDASKITQAKELITGSVSGLIILSLSYVILLQINPNLTKFIPISVSYIEAINLGGDNDSPGVSLDANKIAAVLGVNCGGQDSISQIVSKAKGHATYNQPKRTQTTPEGFVYFDCSSFAGFVLKCATGKSSGQRSAEIFGDQNIWDQKLESIKPGDMVGWAPINNKANSGHVIIYMGNGLFGDCHGGNGKDPGNCVSSSMSYSYVIAYAKSHSDGNLYVKKY